MTITPANQIPSPQQQEKAWRIYCEETAGDMDVKDFWHQLSPDVQQIYLDKASNV